MPATPRFNGNQTFRYVAQTHILRKYNSKCGFIIILFSSLITQRDLVFAGTDSANR